MLADAVAPEVAVYVLVGGFPSYQQLARTGWWDAGARCGITNIGPSFDWDLWFPPGHAPVLEACEAARSARFDAGITGLAVDLY